MVTARIPFLSILHKSKALQVTSNASVESSPPESPITAVFACMCLSLFASGNPDGLEWSMFGNTEAGYGENMGLDEESYGISGKVADTAEAIQEKTAILPDYAFSGSDSAAGTTVSGLVGSAVVAGTAVLICMLGGFFRIRRNKR